MNLNLIKNVLLNRWFILAIFLVLALITLTYFTLPWIWMSFYGLILTIYFSLISKKESYKLIFAYLSILPAFILVLEIYFSIKNNPVCYEYPPPSEYTVKKKKYLGYAPTPDKIINPLQTCNGETVYDVNYTILENGLRYVPSSNINSEACLLFFGGSFTFGMGLNDSESLPNLVGEKTGKYFKIYNFGYIGYGSHQMLSAIENGIVEKTIQHCSSIHAIYTGIPQHVDRALGRVSWGQDGPMYKIINNKATQSGTFRNNLTITGRILDFALSKAETYKHLQNYIRTKIPKTDNDVKLYIAILFKSIKMLNEKYEDTKFSILFWDIDFWNNSSGKRYTDPIIKKAKDGNFTFYLISDILEDYKDNKLQYGFHRYDMHPNLKANDLISDYIGNFILKKK